MKKIFFGSLYFIHLLYFNILVLFFLAVLEVSVLSNLKMSGDWSYFILILLNIFLSYFYAKAGIGKKALIILTIIGVILKILISLISYYKYLDSLAGGREFLPAYYAYFSIGLLDVIFLVGLGINLLIGRRKQYDKN